MRSLAIGLACLALAGCASSTTQQDQPRIVEPPQSTDLTDRPWHGEITAGCRARIDFSAEGIVLTEVAGVFVGGRFTSGPGGALSITIDEVPRGRCAPGAASFLQSVTSYAISQRVLTLSSDSSKIRLRSTRASAFTVAPSLVGLTSSYARRLAEGSGLRYVEETIDGVGQVVTSDLRQDRIRVSVENGIIVSVRVG